MHYPIIRTKDLSKRAVVAIRDVMLECVKREKGMIQFWQRKARETNEMLSDFAMKEMQRQCDALIKEYSRLNASLK